MKKIAFFVQWMLCGGVENALIALSNELVNAGNDVTIYVIKEKGDFLKKIPNLVHLKAIPMASSLRKNIPVGGTKISVRECIAHHEYVNAAKFAVKHVINKNQFAELNVNLDKVPELEEKYDIAVNFHMHSPFLVWYLSERVLATRKYTWIHNDFETSRYDIVKLKKYLNCVDQFFTVAQQLKDEFVMRFPAFEFKTQVALNIVPIKEIRKKGNEFYPAEYKYISEIKLLTVGRLEEQKGYDIALIVCEKLKERGLKFKWFVLGSGTQKENLEKEIAKKNLNDCFYILGNRMNPYPYFKNCDVYVQTSRHEGYVTTVTEAKIFSRPIVTTDVSGAREQLIDGVNGEIADINAENIYERVSKLIKSQEIRNKYIKNLSDLDISYDVKWLKMFM